MRRPMQQGSEKILRDPFIYSTPAPIIIAPGAAVVSNITVEADADFQIMKTCYTAQDNATLGAGSAQTDSTRIIPLCSIQIRDTGSGRDMFSQAVSLTSIFGTGQLPYIWNQPKILAARSIMQLTVTSLVAAGGLTYRLYLDFIGVKMFNVRMP